MFSVKVDDRELRKAFKQLQERQIPYAIAGALNDVAEHTRQDLVAEMSKSFDKPTPFILRAFQVKKAGPRRFEALVGIRDFASAGTPAWKPLSAEAQGGARSMKRLELRLSQLSGGQYIVPGRGAKLDAYGNISRAQIGQVLSRIGPASNLAEASGNKAIDRLRKKGLIAKGQRADYFVARQKGGNKRPIGVYRLVSPGHVEPVLVFTSKAPTYTKRFDPDRIVLAAMNKYGASAIERALAHELATAKE